MADKHAQQDCVSQQNNELVRASTAVQNLLSELACVVDLKLTTDLDQRCQRDVFQETLGSLRQAIERQTILEVSLASKKLSNRIFWERYSREFKPRLMAKWADDEIGHAIARSDSASPSSLTMPLWNLNQDPREINRGGRARAAMEERGNLPGLPAIEQEAGVAGVRKRPPPWCEDRWRLHEGLGHVFLGKSQCAAEQALRDVRHGEFAHRRILQGGRSAHQTKAVLTAAYAPFGCSAEDQNWTRHHVGFKFAFCDHRARHHCVRQIREVRRAACALSLRTDSSTRSARTHKEAKTTWSPSCARQLE